MATTYENMVLREMHRHEGQSKKEWGKQHAADSTVFGLETSEFARLETLKEKVADLCDLQPTPAAMVRPPRKVCEALRVVATLAIRTHAETASDHCSPTTSPVVRSSLAGGAQKYPRRAGQIAR